MKVENQNKELKINQSYKLKKSNYISIELNNILLLNISQISEDSKLEYIKIFNDIALLINISNRKIKINSNQVEKKTFNKINFFYYKHKLSNCFTTEMLLQVKKELTLDLERIKSSKKNLILHSIIIITLLFTIIFALTYYDFWKFNNPSKINETKNESNYQIKVNTDNNKVPQDIINEYIMQVKTCNVNIEIGINNSESCQTSLNLKQKYQSLFEYKQNAILEANKEISILREKYLIKNIVPNVDCYKRPNGVIQFDYESNGWKVWKEQNRICEKIVSDNYKTFISNKSKNWMFSPDTINPSEEAKKIMKKDSDVESYYVGFQFASLNLTKVLTNLDGFNKMVTWHNLSEKINPSIEGKTTFYKVNEKGIEEVNEEKYSDYSILRK